MVNANIIIPILLLCIIIYFISSYDVVIVKKNNKNNLPDKNTTNTKIKSNDVILAIDDNYELIDHKKNGVLKNVMLVLENISSSMSDTDTIKILSSINNYYQTSDSINEFYTRCSKIQSVYPYNTKYTALVINIFIKMHNKYKKSKKKRVNFSKNNEYIAHTKPEPSQSSYDTVKPLEILPYNYALI